MAYLLSRAITIVAYDAQWGVLYEEERQRLHESLGPTVVRMEHIGSTSVPGLGAKAIIDISASVRDLNDVYSFLEPLAHLGYQDARINPAFQRRLFCKGPYSEGTHHLHLTVHGTETWAEPILLRDFLRVHPGVAAEYERVKVASSAQYGRDLDGHHEGKAAFLTETIAAARAWRTNQDRVQ